MKKKIIKLMSYWTGVSFVGLTWYIVTQEWMWQALYYYVWLFMFGGVIWKYREQLSNMLQAWKMTAWKKFLLLGYSMVLLEEIFAALFNHFSEGFELGMYFIRVGQFWVFNMIAFTALIVGWYFLMNNVHYHQWEVFFLCGLWGTLAEGTVSFLVKGNVAIFFVLFPLNILTYGLIMTPAILSVKQTGNRQYHPLIKILLGFMVPLFFSIFLNFLEKYIWSNVPEIFPPRKFLS